MTLTDIYSCVECGFMGSLFQFTPVINYQSKTYVCPKCEKSHHKWELDYVQGKRADIALGICIDDE